MHPHPQSEPNRSGRRMLKSRVKLCGKNDLDLRWVEGWQRDQGSKIGGSRFKGKMTWGSRVGEELRRLESDWHHNCCANNKPWVQENANNEKS